MKQITLEQLLEAGCHFGHQVTRQNPRAREFIYQERDGIHVIDLAKTKEGLQTALDYVKSTAQKGKTILFVGTKRQAQSILSEEAKRANVLYVSSRWVGGTLTNFEQMQKNFRKLRDLRALLANDMERAKYTKKELGLWDKDRMKLEGLYASFADLQKLPDVVFIVDTHKEHLAVKEAILSNIPIVGIVDTNADPTIIDYAIPANDDAVGSLKLIIGAVADAWIEGKKNQEAPKTEEKMEDKKEEVKEEAKKEEKTEAKKAKVEKKEKAEVKESVKEEKPKKKATKKKAE